MSQCIGSTKTVHGPRKCLRPAGPGRQFCFAHDPERKRKNNK